MNIYDFLKTHQIPYERHDHPPVYTCEEAERLVPPLPAAHTKNLFLRDRKGNRHFLIVVDFDKRVDLKALAPLLDERKLSLGSPERMQQYLGVEPGAVSILGVVNDTDRAVEIVIDANLWEADAFQCHPLVNTSTLVIPKTGLRHFLEQTGHPVKTLDVPGLT